MLAFLNTYDKLYNMYISLYIGVQTAKRKYCTLRLEPLI